MFFIILHFIVCVALIFVVLIQQGRGADAGAVFGGGSNTLFGAAGAGNLLTKITTGLAVLFMVLSVYLAFNARAGLSVGSNASPQRKLFKNLPTEENSAKNPAAASQESSAASSDAAPSAPAAPENTAPAPAAQPEAPAAQ